MRIIHAADLHLGRSLHERDLLADQELMLDALGAALLAKEADILLLAGDIYDRAIPPPEAIGLFDSFLTRAIEASPELVVVVIPGNHDSASRLSFASSLLSRAGGHIRSRPEDVVQPIVVEKGGERVCIWALPYLNPGAFSDSPRFGETAREGSPGAVAGVASSVASGLATGGGAPTPGQGELFAEVERPEPLPQGLRSQPELFAEALRRIRPLLDPLMPNLLVAHCYASGGSPSESERAFIGAAEEVPISFFEVFDYVALGHLHRRQAAGRVGRYPGSPLAYSFAEAEASPDKGFLAIDLGPSGFTETFIPVRPLHRVTRIRGSWAELTRPGAHAAQRDDYVEAQLTDPQPILDPAESLRVNFPNLLAVRQAAFEIETADSSPEAAAALAASDAARAARGSEDGAGAVLADFRAFHLEMFGFAPEPETEAIFTALLEEAVHAAD